MRKRAVAPVGVFALVLSVTLLLFGGGSVAFATSPETQPQANQTDSNDQQNGDEENGEGHTKCTIMHNGDHNPHLITVDIHALPAHLNHGDEAQDDNPACQGESSPTQPPPTEPPPTTEPTSTASTQNEGQKKDAVNSTEFVKTCDGKSIKLKSEEKRVLDLHNKTRKHYGLKPLCVDPKLTRAAHSHSQEMIDKDYFRHDSYNGEAFDARLKRFGYDWFASGENVAWGTSSYGTPEGTFERWMESPGHKKNILDENFKEVGIGLASGEYKGSSERAKMYTVDFGARRH